MRVPIARERGGRGDLVASERGHGAGFRLGQAAPNRSALLGYVRAMEIGAGAGRRAGRTAGPRARRRRKGGRCGAGRPAVLGRNGSAGEDGKRKLFHFSRFCKLAPNSN